MKIGHKNKLSQAAEKISQAAKKISASSSKKRKPSTSLLSCKEVRNAEPLNDVSIHEKKLCISFAPAQNKTSII